jgi:hypothetical protein
MHQQTLAGPYLNMVAAATGRIGLWISVWLQLLPVWLALGSCVQLKWGPVEGLAEDSAGAQQRQLG